MIDNALLEEVKRRLIELYNPLAIYIFGSYAWGTPDEESDLDLLIIVDKVADRHRELVDGHRALMGLRVPKDIIVCTQQEFDERADNISTFFYKIKHKGKQIYARL